MKAQATIEFITNIAIWIIFIFAIITAMMAFLQNVTGQKTVVEATILANNMAIRMESLQSTGFTVYYPLEKHKLNKNSVLIEDEKSGKSISVATNFGVEILGQPQ